jgi:hypothetical protein
MKIPVCLFLAVAASGCGQDGLPPAPEWKATVKVVDEAGQPMSRAEVTIGYYVPPPAGQSIATDAKRGKTDTNGLFTASERSRSVDLFFGAVRDGYYKSRRTYELGAAYQYDPVKWSPTVTLVLKKIGQPIPMYAKRVGTKVPIEGQPIGFDLKAGDWVGPFGEGQETHFLFTVHRSIFSDREYEGTVKLTFPNPGDGIIPLPPAPDTGSQLLLPPVAPDAGYAPELVWHHSTTEKPGPVLGYFFRVHTVLDEQGNVQSALYGKMHGDVQFYPGTKVPKAGMSFLYYLNPEPNSRNVEFDPKRNLMKKLGPSEHVRDP